MLSIKNEVNFENLKWIVLEIKLMGVSEAT